PTHISISESSVLRYIFTMSNRVGIEPDNIWPDRDEEFQPGSDVAQPTRTKGAPPSSNLRRSGKGEYVGMDMHEAADDDDYNNVGRSRGAQGVGIDSIGQGEESRVKGGYKATLSNPRVSKEAKQHAKEVLKEDDL
ncbi:hypothetical protein EXT73_36085, partial [Pectobacterium atrosepticum]|nr:hypothetical protein [Pectobacterium polaris]MCL6375751.1 hypothetical protein [Pectobacterium atrosepticum]MCL6395250.1 hypothetical protein [Pectobacterium atrosepticum]